MGRKWRCVYSLRFYDFDYDDGMNGMIDFSMLDRNFYLSVIAIDGLTSIMWLTAERKQPRSAIKANIEFSLLLPNTANEARLRTSNFLPVEDEKTGQLSKIKPPDASMYWDARFPRLA